MRRVIAALAMLARLAGTAMGGITVTHLKSTPLAPAVQLSVARIVFDSAYATGGESLTPANLGLDEIDYITITPDTVAAAGYSFGYDKLNAKAIVLGLEVTLSVDPASFNVVASGDAETLAVNVPATASTITLEEVDASTDLQYVYCRVMAYDFKF